jgi:hypothetical protein
MSVPIDIFASRVEVTCMMACSIQTTAAAVAAVATHKRAETTVSSGGACACKAIAHSTHSSNTLPSASRLTKHTQQQHPALSISPHQAHTAATPCPQHLASPGTHSNKHTALSISPHQAHTATNTRPSATRLTRHTQQQTPYPQHLASPGTHSSNTLPSASRLTRHTLTKACMLHSCTPAWTHEPDPLFHFGPAGAASVAATCWRSSRNGGKSGGSQSGAADLARPHQPCLTRHASRNDKTNTHLDSCAAIVGTAHAHIL